MNQIIDLQRHIPENAYTSGKKRGIKMSSRLTAYNNTTGIQGYMS